MFRTSQLLRCVCRRQFIPGVTPLSRGLRSDHAKQPNIPLEKPREKELVAQWEIVRLGNENGFLSWCRNGYLCSVIAMTLSAQEGALCDELALLALVLASFNMTMGTTGYIYNLHLQKAFVGTRRLSALLYSTGAIGHFMLWALIFTIYVAYEEIEVEVVEKPEE